MRRQADTYKEVRTFEYPGMIVRVHIPDLTEEERARRMKQLYKAAEELLKAKEIVDRKREESCRS